LQFYLPLWQYTLLGLISLENRSARPPTTAESKRGAAVFILGKFKIH
jgi:hypothetical protein